MEEQRAPEDAAPGAVGEKAKLKVTRTLGQASPHLGGREAGIRPQVPGSSPPPAEYAYDSSHPKELPGGDLAATCL